MSSQLREKPWRLYASHLGGYMRRWIARCPQGTLRLHNIRTSDAGRDFHDHPFDFTSLILRGGYIEHVPGCKCWVDYADTTNLARMIRLYGKKFFESNPCRYFGPGSIIRRKAEDFHRLDLVNGEAWTLVLTGPYRRMWGFQTDKGWIPYQEYQRSYYT